MSFLLVSESRHGMNLTSQHTHLSYPFFMFSATWSALSCFVCCSSRQSPGRAETRTYKMSNWMWTTDTVTQAKINKAIPSQEQCSEIHSICCIIHQPLPIFVRQGYICFFHFCSQVHYIWRGKEHEFTPPAGQFPLHFLSLRGHRLLNIIIIPEYSLWPWTATYPLSISQYWIAVKLGERPWQSLGNPMVCRPQFRIPICLLALPCSRGHRSDLSLECCLCSVLPRRNPSSTSMRTG